MNERALITLGLLAACTSSGGPGKAMTRLHEKMRDYQAREPANAIVLTVLGAAAAFYVAERGRNAKVTSFYDALVYAATNLSVGYSDIFAKTPAGKAVGALLMTYGPALATRALDAPGAPQPSANPGATGVSDAAVERIVASLDAILSRTALATRMTEVVALALSFPSVVYTVLLGVVLVYWLFVVVGAINLGDGSADGALDGFDPEGAIGASKGALEGAAKGALQGHLDGVADAAGDVGDFGDGGDGADGGDGDGDADEGSLLGALLNALHLRSVPATVILSLIITFSWLVCTVTMQIAGRDLPHGSVRFVGWLALVLSPLAALPLTSIVARPLAKVFKHQPATQRSDLIGKTCVVRTGTVTSKFGEAMLEDGGAGLVLRVRVDRELPVKRGDLMLIVEWDDEHESFLVEPVDEVLNKRA